MTHNDHNEVCIIKKKFGEYCIVYCRLVLTAQHIHSPTEMQCFVCLSQAAHLLRSWVRIPPGAWIFFCCECRVLSGRGLCDELITCPEESYRLWCVVVCDLETSRIGAPYIYDFSSLGVKGPGKQQCPHPSSKSEPQFYKFYEILLSKHYFNFTLQICGQWIIFHIVLLNTQPWNCFIQCSKYYVSQN